MELKITDEQLEQLIKLIRNYFPKAQAYFYQKPGTSAIQVCLKQDTPIDYTKKVLLDDSLLMSGYPLTVQIHDWEKLQPSEQVEVMKSGQKALSIK